MALLGCVADDFTGATDLASMLVRQGMRAVQLIGVPGKNDPVPDADAIVIALKSRTAPVRDAVRESVAGLNWLRGAGCRQFFFKYCSTFDSTDDGNIGPVADAFVAALDCGFAIACPAFPANARSVFHGHLFVGSALLSESGMENHPLTPMRDANLVRVLGRQTEGTVGLLPFATVQSGSNAVRSAITALRDRGFRYAIADAVTDADLFVLGEASAGHALITGGSGIAIGLPANFRRAGLLSERLDPGTLPPPSGYAAVLAGSCSRATLFQVATARDHVPTLELDALATPDASLLAQQAIAWAADKLGDSPIVIATSAPPDKVAALQAKLGRDAAGTLVEHAMADIAEALVSRGVGRLVIAGGETSGAIVGRLGVRRLRIGKEIDPGVPWTFAEGQSRSLHLALKSGNFGARDFFLKAFDVLADA